MSSPALAPAPSRFRRMPHPDAARPVSGPRPAVAEAMIRPVADRPAPMADTRASGAAYGVRSGPNWGALLVVVAVHVALIGGLMTARMVIARKAPPPVLNTFTVAPPPSAEAPPPAPETRLSPETAQPTASIAAPAPMVALPVAAPVATSPVAAPVPVPTATARAVPAATPAPTPAPPAPITPPDFSAGQLRNAGPAYPYLSRRAKEQGVVTLRVLVTEAGRAGEVRVDRSSGYERLDKAAIATVKGWKFLAARQAGKTIAAWVLVPVTFALN